LAADAPNCSHLDGMVRVTKNLRLFELARVVVRLDHRASFIVNANHSMVRAAEKLGVADCVVDRVWLAIPQATEWQHFGNQIDAAIFSWSNLVNVVRAAHRGGQRLAWSAWLSGLQRLAHYVTGPLLPNARAKCCPA